MDYRPYLYSNLYPPPQIQIPQYPNQPQYPTLNNLMEVINNDYAIPPQMTGYGFYGTNDHLQPILEYLRHDGNEANFARPLSTPTNDPGSSTSTNHIDRPILQSQRDQHESTNPSYDNGVIDLTMDDDIPISRGANRGELIDLITPPLATVQENNVGTVDRNGNSLISAPGACRFGQTVGLLENKSVGIAIPTPKPKPEPDSPLSLICPVCLDGFDVIKMEGRQLIATKCGHVFCSSCIDDIVRKHKHCPTCRKSVRKVSLRVIYL